MFYILKFLFLSAGSLFIVLTMAVLVETKSGTNRTKVLSCLIIILLTLVTLYGCAGSLDFDGNIKGHGETNSSLHKRDVEALRPSSLHSSRGHLVLIARSPLSRLS